MEKDIETVKEFYNQDALMEWKRLEEHPYEFEFTIRMMKRYVKPGDKILDIGGGPGRYSLYFAKMGCDVTLVDLSQSNVDLALEKAKEQNVNIKAYCGDARFIDTIVSDQYDHVFLMGPLYHLINEEDRIQCVHGALSCLKDQGKFYASFILMFSAMIYNMKYIPKAVLSKEEQPYMEKLMKNESYGGPAFTTAYFITSDEIEPFMSQFPLRKEMMFIQEGLFSPCEKNFLEMPDEVIEKWMEVSQQLCTRHEFFGLGEHMMYIAVKE